LPRTLPRSWRETKLLTKVKAGGDGADVAELERRRQLVEDQTPAQLGKITSVADFPVPTLFKKREKKEHQKKSGDDVDDGRSPSRTNVEDMYSNLPRSLKTECLVRTKTDADDETLRERRLLVETCKPSQLAQITSFGDIPVPSALEGIYRPKPKAPKRNKEKDAEKRK
jgi:hypothetical protein